MPSLPEVTHTKTTNQPVNAYLTGKQAFPAPSRQHAEKTAKKAIDLLPLLKSVTLFQAALFLPSQSIAALRYVGPGGRPTYRQDLTSSHGRRGAVSPLVRPRLNRSPTREREESYGGGAGAGLTDLRATESNRRARAHTFVYSIGA